MDQRIGAAEAAARLGVKRETLYAYVSRGLLRSESVDGRSSSFDPREVQQLQGRRRGARAQAVGVPLVSAITRIADGQLHYRGQTVLALLDAPARFEQVAELLWSGTLGDARPLPAWAGDAALVGAARRVQAALPADAPVIDRLRATAAAVSAADPLRADLSPRSLMHTARGLLAAFVDALPAAEGAVRMPAADAPLAQRLWPRLSAQRPSARWLQALDAALVLLADHDIAASTLAVRVAASTRADLYSMLGAGLGVLGGALHGAASAPLHRAFVTAFSAPPAVAAAELLRGSVPAGFGHFLYPEGDPRARALLARVREAAGASRRAARIDDTIALLRDRLQREPNVDCALAALSALAGMRADAGEAVFAIARSAGWVAHGLAELEEEPLRFRPVSRWVG